MRITFDPAKRLRTLTERGLDFEDAIFVFSMRKANAREQAKLAPYFEV